jgi:hypothetical protein
VKGLAASRPALALSAKLDGIKPPGKTSSGREPPREIVGFHRALNRETAPYWDTFGPHRDCVTGLIAGTAGEPGASGGKLAVLGAGNCNDVALDELAGRFAELHLFDLDREAVAGARARQRPEVAERLVLHAPVDLGGALAELGGLRRRPATPDELGALPGSGRELLARVPERFATVASTCLLSQLVHGCRQLLGDEHPQLEEIACAVVVAHVRLLAGLLAPGGVGLLITDTVSSDTYPLEELWLERDPWALIDELEDSGNHLSGTSPRFLRRIVNTDPVVGPLVATCRREPPWLWRLDSDVTYLVHAVRFERTKTGGPDP